MPVGLDCETMFSCLWPQCDGIWRPPEFGSSLAPTALRSISSGVIAERQAQRAVAVVGKEPVVAGLQLHAGCGQDRLVAGAADLEEDQALVLELDLLVVDPPRQDHRAVRAEKLFAREAAALHVGRPLRDRCFTVAYRRRFHACNYIPALSPHVQKAGFVSQPPKLHRWDEIELEKVTEMISRKVVTGEREMLAQIYLKKGAVVPMHNHESEQMTYVLQGALKFLIGGEEITVREGEVLHIPSWVEHQAEALDDTFELDLFARSARTGWTAPTRTSTANRESRSSRQVRHRVRRQQGPGTRHGAVSGAGGGASRHLRTIRRSARTDRHGHPAGDWVDDRADRCGRVERGRCGTPRFARPLGNSARSTS